MKMIFVDAENTGLKALEKINASVIDKVFVFSKAEAAKLICEKLLFLYLSDYPTGANQADFYIVAYLSKVLSSLNKKQPDSVHFELYSNDEALITAFSFQCSQVKAAYRVVRTQEKTVVALPKKNTEANTAKEKLLLALQAPRPLNPDLQKHLGLSKSEFTKAINELSKANKIQRLPESKKKWVQC